MSPAIASYLTSFSSNRWNFINLTLMHVNFPRKCIHNPPTISEELSFERIVSDCSSLNSRCANQHLKFRSGNMANNGDKEDDDSQIWRLHPSRLVCTARLVISCSLTPHSSFAIQIAQILDLYLRGEMFSTKLGFCQAFLLAFVQWTGFGCAKFF